MSDFDLDLDSELDKILENKPIESEFQYYYINLVKIPDLIKFRLIPDINGIPIKYLHNIREGSIPKRDESGSLTYSRVRLCDKSEFINLTEAQSILIDELNSELDKYCNTHPGEWRFVPTKSTGMFFGVVFDVGGFEYNKLKTSLFLITSANFNKYFKEFYDERILSNGTKWVYDSFNRDEYSDYAFSVKSNRITYGYEFLFDYFKYKEINLCQEVFERANDLNEEYIDTINFNEELYSNFLSDIKEYNKEYAESEERYGSSEDPF